MTAARRVWIVLLACAFNTPLHAQTASPEDRLRSALRDTTRQLHEAQDELAGLRAEAATLRQQAATPAACPKAPEISPRARAEINRLVAENAALRQHADEAQKVVAQWQEAQNQWQAGLQQASQQAQTSETAAKTLQQQLEQSGERERGCVAKNARLAQIGSELLERYRDKGMWDAFRNAEPLTQLRRVEFENLLQEYGGKIYENWANTPEKVVERGNEH